MTDPLSTPCDVCGETIDMDNGDTMVIETFDVKPPEGEQPVDAYLVSILKTFGGSADDWAIAEAIIENGQAVAHERCLEETVFDEEIELLSGGEK